LLLPESTVVGEFVDEPADAAEEAFELVLGTVVAFVDLALTPSRLFHDLPWTGDQEWIE
jgi:hypothetical protein